MTKAVPVLLAHPFRPFFLLTGIYGGLVVAAWILFLFAGWPLPIGWSPLQWHSHEMLYGFVPAAIAGFVLTAMTNWTGAQALSGKPLLALIVLWLAGRVVMWFASWIPSWCVAAVDLIFLPALAIYVARVLLRHGNRRNLILVGVLSLIIVGNIMMHIGFISGATDWLKAGQQHGLDVITLMIVIIAGRIIPAFTSNYLRANGGNPDQVHRSVWVERLTITSVILLMPLGWFGAPAPVLAVVALAAGIINAVRLVQWSGWRARREPLLWILHLAYLWIVIALVLRGLSAFVDTIPASLWQHALGVGGIGTLILGVMTRVAAGHTGRPLKLLPFALVIYVAIIAATLLRLMAAANIMDYRLGIGIAAIGWVLAFGLFVIIYGPILSHPRADGRPG